MIGAMLLTHVTRAAAQSCSNLIEYTDPTYGSVVHHLVDTVGQAHNIYYRHVPFNVDATYMVGIQADISNNNWQVVLYTGDGCQIQVLFPITKYDWRMTWSPNDPNLLYVMAGGRSGLYAYNVLTSQATLVKSFKTSGMVMGEAGPSFNQDGTRVFLSLVNKTGTISFHSFDLPGMTNERVFSPTYPAGCVFKDQDERYIGYQNYVATGCGFTGSTVHNTYIYNDDGTLLHEFDNAYLGHSDFSSTGLWAHYSIPWSPKSPLQIHVTSIDGSSDTVVAQFSDVNNLRGLHLSWPKNVTDWFVGSVFSSSFATPPPYQPLFDEIVQFKLDGTYKFLGRSYTMVPAGFSDLWAEPFGSVAPDGSRIAFNSNASGLINEYILYTGEAPAPTPTATATAKATVTPTATFTATPTAKPTPTVRPTPRPYRRW